MMNLTRRHTLAVLLGGAATFPWPAAASALAKPPGESPRASSALGFANAPAEGLGPERLQLVSGRAPEGFAGDLYRNGPAWFRYGDSAVGHWFDGDGLVRRFSFRDGEAVHSARFLDTPKWRAEQAAGAVLYPGFGTAGAPDLAVTSTDDGNPGNTSILPLKGAIWALWEAGSPIAFDPATLETSSLVELRDDLVGMPFLAHPKVEPGGRVWNLGLGGSRCVIWRLAPDGALEDAELITLPRASYIHDWAMTARHLVILLQPWVYERLLPPVIDGLRWAADEPLQVLVIDKDDYSVRRLYEVPAMSFFHTGDAYAETDGTIRVDLCASPDPAWAKTAARDLVAGVDAYTGSHPELVQIVLSPDGGARVERTGLFGEFPQTDRRRQGAARDLTALVANPAVGRHGETALAIWDWRAGRATRFDFGPDHIVEEPLLTPYGPGERDNWIVATTLNLAAEATEVHVFDAASLADGPRASWRSAHAAPLGFHGAFVAG